MVNQRKLRYLEIVQKIKEEFLFQAEYNFPLESERTLAEKYGVSRDTVRRALEILQSENLISKKDRSGSFRLPPVINRDLYAIHSISEDLNPLHLDYSVDILKVAVVKELPENLRSFYPGQDFHKIERRILITGIPTVYEEHYLPLSLFPKFPKTSADRIFVFIEEDCGLKIKDSHQNISLRKPTPKALSALEIHEAVLLSVCSHSYLEDGRLFQLTSQFFHPNYNFKLYVPRRQLG